MMGGEQIYCRVRRCPVNYKDLTQLGHMCDFPCWVDQAQKRREVESRKER